MGAIFPPLHLPSWRAQGQLCFTPASLVLPNEKHSCRLIVPGLLHGRMSSGLAQFFSFLFDTNLQLRAFVAKVRPFNFYSLSYQLVTEDK